MAFKREKVAVYINTVHSEIKGNVYIPQNGRITDFVNNVSKGFIPVTEAVIEMENKTIRTDLIQINKDYIVFIIPQDAMKE